MLHRVCLYYLLGAAVSLTCCHAELSPKVLLPPSKENIDQMFHSRAHFLQKFAKLHKPKGECRDEFLIMGKINQSHANVRMPDDLTSNVFLLIKVEAMGRVETDS